MEGSTSLIAFHGVMAFGLLLLLVVLVQRPWRWGLAATIGMTAAILFDVQQEHSDWLVFLRDIGIGAAGGLAVFAVLVGIEALARRTGFGGDIEILRQVLTLRRHEPQPDAFVPTDRDLTRRWFVVIAAALGSVVGGLMAYGEFWAALQESLQPARVLSALLVVAVAVVLVGPVQEFVLGRSLARGASGEAPGESFAALLAGRRSLRSVLRLLLVFAFALILLELVNNSLDQTIASAGSRASFTLVTASMVPALVTMGWCVALQRSLPRRRLLGASFWSATIAFAVIIYVPCWAMNIGFALSDLKYGPPGSGGKAVLALVASPLSGAVVAIVLGVGAAGIYAGLGALALGYLRGWIAMAALLTALLVAACVNQLGAVGYVYVFAQVSDWSGFGDMLVSAVGWWVGLLASGFPRIVSGYAAPTGDGAGASATA